IVPKLAAPRTPLGDPSGGVFSRLNTSTRNSTARSPTDIRRATTTSTLRYAGPRTGLRDALPSANWGVTANALGLNHPFASRTSAGSAGAAISVGRCTPKPANALKLVACVTATGTPDWSVTIAATVHPRQSQTTDETNTCGMSPVE